MYIAFFVFIDNNKYNIINIDITETPITGTNNFNIVILYPDIKFDNIFITIPLYITLEYSSTLDSKSSAYSKNFVISSLSLFVTDSKSSEVANNLFISRIRFFTSKFCIEAFSDILSMAIYSAISSTAGGEEEGVFSISYEIETDYFEEPYKVNDRILAYSSTDAFKSAIEQLISPIDFFIYNNFNRVGIKSVKLSIKRNNLEYAFLNDITLVEPRAVAGETIHLRVGLTPYGKEKQYIDIPVKLPVNLKTDVYSIYAANEYIYNYAEQLFMPNKYEIRSLDDVMRIYGKSYDDSSLRVWLYSSSRGVQIGKDLYPTLPPSRYGIMAKNATSDKAAVITAVDGKYEMPCSTLGLIKLDIIIEGARKYENR